MALIAYLVLLTDFLYYTRQFFCKWKCRYYANPTNGMGVFLAWKIDFEINLESKCINIVKKLLLKRNETLWYYKNQHKSLEKKVKK